MSEVRNELIASRDNLKLNLERSRKQAAGWVMTCEDQEARIRDYDRAIAALTPQAAPDLTAAVAEPEIPAGFTKWEGGECPVDPEARVSVVFKDGHVSHDQVIAGWMNWAHDETCASRIYAYRVTEQASAHQSEEAAVSVLSGGDDQDDVVVSSPGEGEESRDQFETTESDPDPVLRAFEDDQIVASPWIDEQTCEPINPHVEAEGYAPVVAADEPEPQPESLMDRFNPFRVKADA